MTGLSSKNFPPSTPHSQDELLLVKAGRAPTRYVLFLFVALSDLFAESERADDEKQKRHQGENA
jgi:hypothetical protein